MTNQDKILSALGMAARARRLADGAFSVEQAIKTGQACLVIVTVDASDNTKKDFRDMCLYYHVPFYLYSKKEILGHAIGKEFRAAVAVLDDGFANSIEKRLKDLKQTEAVEWQK